MTDFINVTPQQIPFYQAGGRGIKGDQGTIWHNGAGAPDNALGVPSDKYMDNLNGQIYTKNQSNFWVMDVGANLKGSRGVGFFANAGTPTGAAFPAGFVPQVGDSYLDTTTYIVYQYTINALWEFVFLFPRGQGYMEWLASETRAGHDLVLIIGQSNSVGQSGKLFNILNRQGKGHVRINQLRALNNTKVAVAFDPLYQLNHPDTNYSISPTVYMVKYYLIMMGAINQNREVLFIPRGVGGTGFDGTTQSWTAPNGNLFVDARDDMIVGMNLLLSGQTANYNRLIMIYWNQMEANLAYTTNLYARKFFDLHLSMKAAVPQTLAFSNADVEKVPVIVGAAPSWAQSYVLAKEIRAAEIGEMALALPAGSYVTGDADLEQDAGEFFRSIIAVNTTANTVTFDAPIMADFEREVQTGDWVALNAPLPAGLTANQWVVAIRIGTTAEYAFATSIPNALNDTRIDITSTTTGGSHVRGRGTARIDVLHDDERGIRAKDEMMFTALPLAYKNLGNIKPPFIKAVQIAPTEVVIYSDNFVNATFGNPIKYSIQYRLQGSGSWITFEEAARNAAYLVTGLTQGATYEFRVVAPNARYAYVNGSNTVTVTMSLATAIIDAEWLGVENAVLNGLTVSSWPSTRQQGATPYEWANAVTSQQPNFIASSFTGLWPLKSAYIDFQVGDMLIGNAQLLAWTAGKRWLMPMLWHFHTGLTSTNGYIMHFGTEGSATATRASYRPTGNTTFSTSTALAPADNSNRVFQPVSPPTNRDTYSTAAYFCDLNEAANLARGRTFYDGVQVGNSTIANTFGNTLTNSNSAAAYLFDTRNTQGSLDIRSMLLLSGTTAPPANIAEIAEALHYYIRSV